MQSEGYVVNININTTKNPFGDNLKGFFVLGFFELLV
jgi:hypothetical protein